jgi:transcriptional regulator with XRE-family HTH domain
MARNEDRDPDEPTDPAADSPATELPARRRSQGLAADGDPGLPDPAAQPRYRRAGGLAAPPPLYDPVGSGVSGGGPTVLKMLLGAQLRRLRESAGFSRDDAGYHIRASGSKISRMELGRVSFKERDVIDLLEFYGVRDLTERGKLLQLTREANATPWFQKFQDIVPDWFHVFVGLEEAAQLIRVYEVQFVPGLLQTEEYARAVILQGAPEMEPDEVERRVALRMGRQKLLTRENPPRYWVVMDEAALRRPIGGRDVYAAQIEHLIHLAGEPNITIQVMPFAYGGHAAESGAFTIMRFPETDLPDVVYMEYLTGAHYIDKPEEVERYAAVMGRLSVAGTSPDRTRTMLTGLLDEADD